MSIKSEAYLPLMTSDPESPHELERICLCHEQHQGFSTRKSVKGRCFVVKDMALLAIILAQAICIIIMLVAGRYSDAVYGGIVQISQANTGASLDSKLYSPANAILEDRIQIFVDGFAKKTIYQEYTDEADKAWGELYNHTMMKIPKSEAALIPNKTWPIKESPGYYIAQLDVFHQLHCVNKIRQAFRRDRYDPLYEFPDEEFAPAHVSHCIDSVRQYVMCHVDTAVIFWQWDPQDAVVKPSLEYPHMCKNFDKIHEWTAQRHIDDYIDTKAYVQDDLPTPPIIY